MKNKIKLFRCFLTAGLVSVLIILTGHSPAAGAEDYPGVKHVNADGSQTFYSGIGSSEIITVDFSDINKCVFTGKHVDSMGRLPAGSSHIIYATTGFSFYRTPGSDKKESISAGDFMLEDRSKNGYIYTTYTFSWDRLYEILERLGFTEEELWRDEGVTVYMSNIFCTRDAYKTESGILYSDRKTNLKTLKDMLAAESWGSETRGILPCYYDMPITIRKAYYSVDKIKTNCSDCALLNVRAIEKGENSFNYCKKHEKDHSGVWFKLEKPSEETEKKYDRSNGLVIRAVKQEMSYDGKEWELDAELKDGVIESCDSWFVYFDSRAKDKSGIINPKYSFFPYDVKGAVYRLFLQENGNYGIRVRRHKSYDGAIILPYREKEEKPDEEEEGAELPVQEYEREEVRAVIYNDADPETILYSNVFDVEEAIPTTEFLNAEVRCKEYLIEAELEEVKGRAVYPVSVELPYSLTYMGPDSYEYNEDGSIKTDENGNRIVIPGEPVTAEGTIRGTINVARDYSYTRIGSLAVYRIREARIVNELLEENPLILYPENYIPPEISYTVLTDGENGHVLAPDRVTETIVLPLYSAESGGKKRPALPKLQDYSGYLDDIIDEISVRNDTLVIGGKEVMNGEYSLRAAPSPDYEAIEEPPLLPRKVLHREEMVIPPGMLNRVYDSMGFVIYERYIEYHSEAEEEIYAPLEVNSVKVHTPVACKGYLLCDNYAYVQLFSGPDTGLTELVLGRSDGEESKGSENASCDFYIRVSNIREHISAPGYGKRDYSKNLSGAAGGSYILFDGQTQRLLNQVFFPFDVFIDTYNDRDESNDIFLPAKTWYTVGTQTIRAYIPMWVREGDYEVDFRTIAVNGGSRLKFEEKYINGSYLNYVATDKVDVRVSAKLYDFEMENVEGDKEWRTVFDGKDTVFHTGPENELGIRRAKDPDLTLPTLAGSNPAYLNRGVLKAGYPVDFSFKVSGGDINLSSSAVKLTPHYYRVDSRGKNRTEVDIYSADGLKINAVTIKAGDSYPANESYERMIGSRPDYGGIRLTATTAAKSGAMEKGFLSTLKTAFPYSLYIPENFRICPAGTDVSGSFGLEGTDFYEGCWYKSGYLIVSFEITVSKAGADYISYRNAVSDACCMWETEGLKKKVSDYYGTEFSFECGDVFIFYVDKSISDDYESLKLY